MSLQRVRLVFAVVLAGIPMACVSAAICWSSVERLWHAHVVAGWPVVQGAVGAADIVETHVPKAGKSVAWDGWCVSWDYAYDWHGERFHARLVDPTPSMYSTGCFAYRAGAEKSAQRRPPGSAIALRVDPEQPQESSVLPAASPAGDIAALVFGLLPFLIGLASISDLLREKPQADGAKIG